MSTNPGAAVGGLGLSAGQSIRDLILERPTLAVPVIAIAQSVLISSRPSILVGWVLREALGAGVKVYTAATSSLPAAANNVSIPAGGAGTLNYVTAIGVSGGGATAASVIALSILGTAGANFGWYYFVPAGAGIAAPTFVMEFAGPGIPASALNSAITLSCPSFGAGNAQASAYIRGYTVSGVSTAAADPPGVGVAVFDLLDGQDANGVPVGGVSLPAGGMSAEMPLGDGPLCRGGVFLKRTSGTITGAVWVKQ